MVNKYHIVHISSPDNARVKVFLDNGEPLEERVDYQTWLYLLREDIEVTDINSHTVSSLEEFAAWYEPLVWAAKHSNQQHWHQATDVILENIEQILREIRAAQFGYRGPLDKLMVKDD